MSAKHPPGALAWRVLTWHVSGTQHLAHAFEGEATRAICGAHATDLEPRYFEDATEEVDEHWPRCRNCKRVAFPVARGQREFFFHD